VDVIDMAPGEISKYVRADYDKWLKVVREGNIPDE